MKEILKLNSISPLANAILSDYTLADSSQNPVGILVRSFNMNEYALPDSVLAVARAGAGVNNIPHAELAKSGVVVFNTPGANANAVQELVLASLILASRNVIDACDWAKQLEGDDIPKQVEKGKSNFAGNEIFGKTLCILGLGAIGRLLAKSAHALGMNVVGYDPYLSDTLRSEIDFVTVYDDMTVAVADADYISIHTPMTADTKGFVNAEFMSHMRDGVIIVNAARGELVVTEDIKMAIASGKVKKYVVDFPNKDTINSKNIIAIPHLGASSAEAEDNCAIMASNQLKDYIENGNIKNSVNMPNLSLAKTANHRYTIVSNADTILPELGTSATRNGIRFTIIDTDGEMDMSQFDIDGVIASRKVY